ncbi:MAG: DUF2384 domain-containing protein [Taibaiella sp.]|nr:DUF2384 domain-containing protein [Taibaiella sp.]
MEKKPYKSEKKKDNLVSEQAINYYTPMASRTINLMGMDHKKDFRPIKNESDLIHLIREGIPMQAMSHLMDMTGITALEMASITHTSDRTLRRYTPEQKLSQEQSERMIEVARLYSRGEEVFGSLPLFKEWMDTMLMPLGNKKPKEFLDTSLGINMLINELGRIEHGVLA